MEFLLGDPEHLLQRQLHLVVADSFFQDLPQVRHPFYLCGQPVTSLLRSIQCTGDTCVILLRPEPGLIPL